MVMIEGTNLSEGRGTTRPFEMMGAAFIEPYSLVEQLNKERLPGVVFRPLYFQPTFHKFAGEICGGIQIHVIDRTVYKPVITGVAITSTIRRLNPEQFAWKPPPYEYEFEKMPIDCLAGSSVLRQQIESGISPREIARSWQDDVDRFDAIRRKFLLY